jgi:hypothetical protein
MKKLEEFVNEKLRITKGLTDRSATPDLKAILKSKDVNDYESRCKQLIEYLNNGSDLPVAELIDWNNGRKRISRKYQNSDDIFLCVFETFIFYGTWDNKYSTYWSSLNNGVRNLIDGDGFSDFSTNDSEISESGGIYIITENTELVKHIDYLIEHAEHEL